VVYGLQGEAPARHRYVLGTDLQLHAAGLRLEVHSSWGDARLVSPLLGRFNAYNLLAALAVLLVRGTPLAEAAAALAACTTVPGRVEAFGGGAAAPLVVVDYAHTPQALAQVLTALRAHTAGRLVCVFGCGGDRDRGKRPLMGRAAAELADAAILTDDNPRSENPQAIADDILAGVPAALRGKLLVEHSRARAITRAVRGAGAGDVVLVAGKGHEDYQIYGNQRREFSDRRFVAELLGVAAAGGKRESVE
jgi:UDP-N-acetylmuramoyl-L-alanyl-D-glutamate--2,6-diaminopimelate ligase